MPKGFPGAIWDSPKRRWSAAIATGEKELDALRAKLKMSQGDDWEKLAKMAQEEQALAKRVDAMLIEWARLSEEVAV